ncbi:MAG: GNAT family N-acetyltransferase [Acidobacteriaceae bacterium]|nr:GNAT family N-acetyltransferase [Acidobacteriaceae bacterium]
MVEIVVREGTGSSADARLEAGWGNFGGCSLWWTDTPALAGERIGVIGEYSAGDPDFSRQLLDRACQWLADRGCAAAVGPMDGSTWKKYRFITERGEQPLFFLEPSNPPAYPTYFQAAGFKVLASYTSAITSGLELQDARVERVEKRLLREGFRIRALDLGRFEQELHVLYEVSVAAFASNFLYKPISEEEFSALYQPIRNYIRPELVLFAERDGETAAFLFAIPDPGSRNFIIKTLAAHPRFAGRGLGTVLIQHANRAAWAAGYKGAIHALMHEENQSTRISARQAQVFRRYSLFARRLSDAQTA